MKNELVQHIEALNAKTAAWVAEKPETRFGGMLVTDPAYWAKSDVFTPEQLDKYLVVVDVFEATRSAYGYKPSWSGLMSTPIADLRKELAALTETIREQIEFEANEERRHEEAVKAAFVPKTFSIGDLFPALA